MYKTLKVFAALVICVIITFLCLLWLSGRNARTDNGFQRVFTDQKIRLKASIYLQPARYAIAGTSANDIVLYNIKVPAELIRFSKDLRDKKFIPLHLDSAVLKAGGANYLRLYGQKLFLINGNSSTLYSMDVKENQMSEKHKLDSLPSNQSELLSDSTFLLMNRLQFQGIKRRVLKLVDRKGNLKTSFMPEKQVDGYFCTDGQFAYDPQSRRTAYMFFYRGEFVCLDSAMKVLYKAKTIDTVTKANIVTHKTRVKIKGLNVDRTTTVKPPAIINRRVEISAGFVYVQSYLKADNENDKDFEANAVIDVYSLATGKYCTSFYLPKLEGQKLVQMKISGNTMVVLYKRNLAVFEIPRL